MATATDEAVLSRYGRAGRRVRIPEHGVAVVDRPRLTSRLDAADVAELVAPAGFGKTTLLASWAAQSDGVVAWLTLTAADADPARFVRDLLDALLVSGHPALAGLAALEAQLDADLSVFVTGVHDALAESPDLMSIVVDDTHQVAKAPATLRLLSALVLDGPPQLRVLLAGRQELAPDLTLLRTGRQVVTIREPDLAFTPAETDAVMATLPDALGVQYPGQVHAATAGWPVAVRLCLLAARSGDRPEPPDPARIPDLTEYLVTEVLNTLEPEARSFVADASVDDMVCASLLDSVRARADSEVLLRSMHQRGLFLTFEGRGAAGESWYRWHQMFVAHVRRAVGVEDPARQRTLHARAAMWWSSVDSVVAVRHALRAGRSELGAELAADAWPELVLAGMTDLVLDLVSELPPGLVREAELHLALAFVEAERGDRARARHSLRSAHLVVGRLPEPDRARFDAREAALSLFFVAAGDSALPRTVERGRELLRRLEDGPWTPDPVTLMLTRLCVGMGEARLQQDYHYALRMLESAAAIAHERRFTAIRLIARAETCLPRMATDAAVAAEAAAREVLSTAERQGWGPPRALAAALTLQGLLAYWRSELDDARTKLSAAIGLLHGADLNLIAQAEYFRALACLQLEDFGTAQAGLEVIDSLARHRGVAPFWPSLATALEAEVHLARGEGPLAWKLMAARAPGRQHPLARTTRARVLARLGSPDAALTALDELARTPHSTQIRARALRIRAYALWRSGAPDAARKAVDDALGLAEPMRLLQPFLEDRAEMLPVLQEIQGSCSHPEMLEWVLAQLDESQRRAVPREQLLTARERAILRYLQTGLTLAEIAAAEYVSINTVKTHTRSIYRKLGVGGRRDGVRVAVELGIL